MLVGEAKVMHDTLLKRVGNTPLLPLEKIFKDFGKTVYAKAEMLNPGGSVKDRLAKSMIEAAEANGSLPPGGTVVEVTSGNTGIAVAWVCAIKGYRALLVMSDKNSEEKQNMMKLYGAELVLTPHTVMPDDPRSNYKTAERLAETTPDSTYLDQYNNPANIDCHYQTTGPEIWEQTEGNIDCAIIGAGTGGTISGVARFLKERNRDIKIIAVDPEGSIFAPYFKKGELITPEHYEVEGIGGDKLVGAMDFDVVDEFVTIGDREAFLNTRELARVEGLFCGGSSGAAIAACRRVLKSHPEIKCPVTILADSGNRYLSKLYSDKWMIEKGYLNRP
ncbi:MAG: cysteine synthase family protein [Candidatus Zixiibacteriota bacterium]|nr:MAG: cysteine synthase family protein [candidate division Zixibacteria bacterium]